MSNFFRRVERNQLKKKYKNKYIRTAYHEGEEKADIHIKNIKIAKEKKGNK